jgi:hypothetical protein
MSYHKYNPVPHEFHPEFGYLGPSRKLQHMVRVALAAAVFGVIMGAVSVLVLLPRHDRGPAPSEPARVAAPAEVPAGAVVQTGAAVEAAATSAQAVREPAGATGQSPPATSPRPQADKATADKVNADKANQADKANDAASSSAAGSGNSCKEETWPYFDSNCLWGPARKDRNAPTPPAAAPAPAAAAKTAKAAATATSPSEHRQISPAKKQRTANSSPRRRKEVQEPRNAFASPFGYRRQAFGGYSYDYSGYSQPRRESRGWSW